MSRSTHQGNTSTVTSSTDKRTWAGQLLSQVLTIQHARGKDQQKEIKHLEVMIRMEINDAGLMSRLNHHIEDHAKDIKDRISAIHSHLSDNDLFLCACIHLGISISDISSIRMIDPSSVVVSRYRLKKKLGLPSHDELDEYIARVLR